MNREDLLAALGPALDRALDLEPEARARWLAELRLAQPALAHELEALLETEPAVDAQAFLATPHAAPVSPGLAGSRIGAYTLVRPLGRGGMGTVWLARRSDGHFESAVAFKLLPMALLDPVALERFRREGQALARLQHPGIARLHDAGVTSAGIPYLVLELVEGARIDEYCEVHRLPPRERVALVRQVAGAVAHAHANLIIHRDLKPSNILVADDGTVKLLDFGVAKLIGSESPEGEITELTGLGGTPFTPEYAAPEQASGRPTTTATDVYSLGILLYRLLSGRHPTGTDSRTSSDYLRSTVETDPRPLSAAAAAGAPVSLGASRAHLRRLYAGDLDNILARALEKDPARRYATVNEFADDLGRFLRSEPVLARPASLGYRARKFVSRNRISVAAAVVTATLLIAAAVAALSQAAEARRQRDVASAERDRAILGERRAAATNSFLQTLLGTVGTSTKPLTTAGLLEQARVLLERDFAANPAFAARTLLDLSSQYGQFANAIESSRLTERAEILARQSGDPETIALVECALARRDARAPGGAGAGHLRKGREALALVPEPGHEARVGCLVAEAWVADGLQQRERAVRRAREALGLAVSVGDTASFRYLDILTTLDGIRGDGDQIREHLEAARRRARTYLRLGRGNTVGMVGTLQEEARALLFLGEYRSADSAFAALRPIVSQVAPEFLNNFVLIHVASLADILGRPDTALAIYSTQLRAARSAAEKDRERWVYLQMVTPLISLGRLNEADRMADAADRIAPPDGFSRSKRAQLAAAHGHADSALRLDLQRLAELGYPARPIPEWESRLLARTAELALNTGRHETVDSVARYALAHLARLGHDPARSGEVGTIMLLLARSDLVRGDSAASRVWARRSLAPLTFGLGPRHPRTLEASGLAGRP